MLDKCRIVAVFCNQRGDFCVVYHVCKVAKILACEREVCLGPWKNSVEIVVMRNR